MKIQKYVFLFHAAVEVASKRLNIPNLKTSDCFVLYSIAYLPKATHGSLMRHNEDMRYNVTAMTISTSLRTLLDAELISLDSRVYSITWKGREFMSYVRRYLLHKRIS